MYAVTGRDQALALVAAGVNDCEIGRRLGIPRTTVRDWPRTCLDNLSEDILGLFIDACRLVGVECRWSGESVRIYRRTSVAPMLEHAGVKA